MLRARSLVLLVGAMALVLLAAGGTSLVVLYRHAVEQERSRLLEVAKSHAHLIGAVARFDQRHIAEGEWTAATLSQVNEALVHDAAGASPLRFHLARRTAGGVVVLAPEGGSGAEPTWLATLLDGALAGESGTRRVRDAQGAELLAAFTPVEGAPWGLIATLRLDHVRTPFVQAGVLAGVVAVTIVLAAGLVLVRLIRPHVRRLAEREQFYRTVIEFAADFVYWRDPAGRARYIAPACTEVTGYAVEEFLERPELFDEIVHPDDRRLWVEHDEAARGGHGGGDLEFRIITKGGEVRWVNHTCRPIRDAAGNFLGLRGANRDITTRRRAEEERGNAQRLNEGIVGTLREALLVLDGELRVVTANRTFQESFALTPGQVVGHSIFAIDEGRWDVPRLRDLLERVLPEHRSFEGLELEYDSPATGRRTLMINAQGIVHDGDELELILLALEDVTERKRAEEALARHRDELEAQVAERTADLARSNAELAQFAYVASHDLQEPLRMVTSFCQLLQKRYGGRLDADADEFIGYAVDGAERMQRLIQDLLTYSRVGRDEAPLRAVSAAEACDQAIANLKALIEEHGAVVSRGELPVVSAREGDLSRLFQNLIQNGIKFRGEDPPRVEVAAEAREGEWAFFVRDNGIGVDSEHQERIFQIFQRLHPRSVHPGTGIGLAIARKITEQFGGRLWVESEPGTGSVFCFTMPRAAGDGVDHVQ